MSCGKSTIADFSEEPDGKEKMDPKNYELYREIASVEINKVKEYLSKLSSSSDIKFMNVVKLIVKMKKELPTTTFLEKYDEYVAQGGKMDRIPSLSPFEVSYLNTYFRHYAIADYLVSISDNYKITKNSWVYILERLSYVGKNFNPYQKNQSMSIYSKYMIKKEKHRKVLEYVSKDPDLKKGFDRAEKIIRKMEKQYSNLKILSVSLLDE